MLYVDTFLNVGLKFPIILRSIVMNDADIAEISSATSKMCGNRPKLFFHNWKDNIFNYR